MSRPGITTTHITQRRLSEPNSPIALRLYLRSAPSRKFAVSFDDLDRALQQRLGRRHFRLTARLAFQGFRRETDVSRAGAQSIRVRATLPKPRSSRLRRAKVRR